MIRLSKRSTESIDCLEIGEVRQMRKILPAARPHTPTGIDVIDQLKQVSEQIAKLQQPAEPSQEIDALGKGNCGKKGGPPRNNIC